MNRLPVSVLSWVTVMKKLFLLMHIFIAIIASDVAANSCRRDFDIENLDKRSEIVIAANVIRDSGFHFFNRKYTLKVIKTYKGVSQDEVIVWSKKSESSCGIKLEAGYTYIIFAYKVDDKLRITSSSSWPLTDGYKKQTEDFNNFFHLNDGSLLKASNP